MGLFLAIFFQFLLFSANEGSVEMNPERENIRTEFVYYQGNTIHPIANTYSPKVSGSLFVENNYYYIVSQYDWDVRVAYAVMMAESNGNPNAENWRDNHRICMGSFGLFQLACFRGDINTLKDPETNIRMAYELWSREGWRPWGAYTSKAYLRFL